MPDLAAAASLWCPRCQRDFRPGLTRVRCPEGHLLDLVPPDVTRPAQPWRGCFDGRLAQRSGLESSGVWRFREWLLATDAHHVVSLDEGNTPLLSLPPVAAWAGTEHLLVKHEGLNPTGSFKDRGMTVGVTVARRLGARSVACASTGNTAASLAAYAARAGLDAVVLLPAGGVSPGKLAQARAHGAMIVEVRGDFDRCLALLEDAAEDLGLYLLNSINPFRIAGQQTIIWDLLQQLQWNPPDWIAFPAGNLGNTSAFGSAVRLALRAGVIDRPPRLAAVQAEGAAPFARSYRSGFDSLEPVEAHTVASAIRIGRPASFPRAVEAIRETAGVVTDVTDADILEAKAAIDRAGLGCEPASAAAVAGVRRLRREGVIVDGARVVAVLTGHLLKEPGASPGSETSIEIGDRPEDLAAALDRL